MRDFNEAMSNLADEMGRLNKENSQLTEQLAKANERVKELEKENKRESMELRSRLGSALGRNSEIVEQLVKAIERITELESEQLPIENGKNRYGLDISYFRNVINRELNKPLDNYKPDELARVFARLSRTADESVMFEPEFSDKFSLDQKI